MMVWGFRWFTFFLRPYKDDEFGHITSDSERRAHILGRLEQAKLSEWSWVIVVAGVGFFTDSYCIFSINMVTPMLGIIYYQENGGLMPHNYETALSVVTLGGSIIGQVAFGAAADVFGRRKMYGLELIITIAATLGVVMASNGTEGSMSIIVWLLFWRFVVGIGIGADYPLSAVICSEFAPTRLRGRMLTLVFMCQPLGQIAATLVTLIAISRQEDEIPAGSTVTNCTGQCLKSLDSVWRWIIGVGVIPAVIALWFRLTIIESPRYTADVGGDSRRALSELNRYIPSNSLSANSSSSSVELVVEHHNLSQRQNGVSASEDGGTTLQNTSGGISPNQQVDTDLENPSLMGNEELQAPPEASFVDFKDYFWHRGNLRTLLATSLCWFFLDLPFYGLGMNSPRIITTIWYGKNGTPPAPIIKLMIHNVWQSLVVVSFGAILGCILTLASIDRIGRRNIQMIGFFWLFILFIIIGSTFTHLYEANSTSAIIVLYILCQIFFNFGPNTTTYIMPAELFPTRYRALCHGIAAAFGKLGSVVAQLFLAYIDYGKGINYTQIQKWLPYSLLIFSFFMLCGLAVTIYWLPRQEHGAGGSIKTLEEWEIGRETNGFSTSWLATRIAPVYHWAAKTWDQIYMFLDKLSGGEEAEKREEEAEMREERRREQEEEREMAVIAQEGGSSRC